MPTNTLYWYGYMDSDTEFTTTSNGWANSTPYNYPPFAPTQNTNDIYGEAGSGGAQYSGFASKTSKTYSNNTVHFIGSMAQISSNTPSSYYPYVGILDSKSGGSTTADMPIKDLFTDEHRTGSITGTGYLTACTNCAYVTSITIKALWYE